LLEVLVHGGREYLVMAPRRELSNWNANRAVKLEREFALSGYTFSRYETHVLSIPDVIYV
jgi:hypothetical protein